MRAGPAHPAGAGIAFVAVVPRGIMTTTVEQHPLFTRQFIDDPYPVYAKLRDDEAVSRAPSPHGFDMWTLARYDDVKASLTDQRLSRDLRLAPPGVVAYTGGSDLLTNKSLLSVDPPDHTRMRRLVQSAFTGRRVKELEGWIDDLVARLLEGMQGREQVDLVHAFGFALPLTVICRLMGIPVGDRPNFRRWMDGLVMSGAGSAAKERLRESQRNLATYCQDLIRRKRSEPEDDLMSALVHALDEEEALTEEELVGVTFHLLIAGHETTVGLLTSSAMLLLCHPDQRARVQAEPALWPTAVDEMMRFESPWGSPWPSPQRTSPTAAPRSRRARWWPACSRRPTATRGAIPTRTGSTSPGPTTPSSGSAPASTGASGRCWP